MEPTTTVEKLLRLKRWLNVMHERVFWEKSVKDFEEDVWDALGELAWLHANL